MLQHLHRSWARVDRCWLAQAATLLTMAVIAAGCSGGSESTTPTIELSSTSTPITTVPVTEPTTTEAPTTTIDPRIAEVEAAVVAFRETQVEVLTNPEAPLELLNEVASGELLDAAIENAAMARAEGRTFDGDYERLTLEISLVGPSSAAVTECGHDRVRVLSTGGEVLTPADDFPYLRETSLERDLAGDWKVLAIVFPGAEKEACEL